MKVRAEKSSGKGISFSFGRSQDTAGVPEIPRSISDCATCRHEMTILPGCKFLGDVGHGLAEYFDRRVGFVGGGPHLFDLRVGSISFGRVAPKHLRRNFKPPPR